MPQSMIEDKDRFYAFLAAQPLLKWLDQKQHDPGAGMYSGGKRSPAHPASQNDNADLAAALSSMA